MKILSITIFFLGLSAAVLLVSSTSSKLQKLELKTIYQIAGQEILEEFIGKSQLTVVYYYKKDLPRIKFFFKELDKSAEYLELYGVKVGVVDCFAKENQDVKICELQKVEDNVYTYRNGNQLLSLEFDTMFDVNSIMSNVLQLVMLRQVPIVQTPKEVKGLLARMRGKHDVIFGHTKAIGTFGNAMRYSGQSDHRVFVEVAYAYQNKFKFALCTDEQAITAFSELPTEDAQSNIYVIFTKDSLADEEFTGLHSIKYRADLTLPGFAKWLMLLSLPRMYNFPQDGQENPYANVDAPAVKLYYDANSAKLVAETATLISNHYWGMLTLTVIDMDETVSQETFPMEGKLPTISIMMPESLLVFMKMPFGTENIANFLEESLQSKMPPKLSEEERQQNYDSPAPPEIHEDAPYIDHEALDVQDDEVADAVQKNREPMPLALVPALTDKTFPTTIQGADIALVYFYIPFDAMNMAFLRKYGEAADRLGASTKLSVNRVNCYDWTDVCSLNNITSYPTLRVFENGEKSWDYRGPRDTQELYSTFRLLELSSPVYETYPARVKAYLAGNLDSDVKSFTSVVVMGLFSKENKKEIEVFGEVAKSSRDRILFVYSDIEDTKIIATQFTTTVPAVIISRYEDTVQPYVVYTGQYETDALRSFIQDNKLPKLTILTPLVFPELHKRGQDFLILFTDDSPMSQDRENTMREILHTGQYNNVSFTLMPVPDESSVGYKVLHQYSKDATVPFISYVDLKVGEVFNFEALVFQKDRLMGWISDVSKRVIKPSAVLKDSEWKPVQRGYDFLKIIDWEKAQAKQKHKPKPEDSSGWDREEADPQAGDNGDEETRQELFELHNSRLYSKSGHSKHPAGKEEPVGTGQKQKSEGTGQGEMGQKQEPTGTEEKLWAANLKEDKKETSQKQKPAETSQEPEKASQKQEQMTTSQNQEPEKAGQKQEEMKTSHKQEPVEGSQKQETSGGKDKAQSKHTEL